MPIDDRLRDGLRRDAAAIEPDVERHLERVVRRSRGRSRSVRSLVALAASIAGLVVLVQLAGIAPLAPPSPTQLPTAIPTPDPHPLAGTYRVELDGTDPAIGAPGMGGRWTITLGRDASVVAVPPPSFATTSRRQVGRAVYAVAGDLLHTSLLAREMGPQCAGSGTYRWQAGAGRVRFTLVDDTCEARVALLTGAPWIAEGP